MMEVLRVVAGSGNLATVICVGMVCVVVLVLIFCVRGTMNRADQLSHERMVRDHELEHQRRMLTK